LSRDPAHWRQSRRSSQPTLQPKAASTTTGRACSLSRCFVSEVRFFGEMVLDAEFTARL
jgi:hypothetical protein